MKKYLLLAIVALMAPVISMNGQTYSSLWKQVEKAVDDDLPQTEQKLLRQIAKKAEAEKQYGQLLKAELQEARSLASVSSDSLAPAVGRLQKREQQTKDGALRAVYQTVLGYIYANEPSLTEDGNGVKISAEYYDKAMTNPSLLAATKASTFSPLIIEGVDSKIFDNDLLSVIGYETKHYKVMRDYYINSGNRRAALFTSLKVLEEERPEEIVALNKSVYIQRIDSLINEYADLPEAGEAAIERYNYMDDYTFAKTEQKWQYINQALDHWGSWPRMNILRNEQRSMTSPKFSASLDHEVYLPGKTQKVSLTGLRAIHQLTMKVYRVKADGDIDLNLHDQKDLKKLKPLLTELPEYGQTKNFVGHQSYISFTDSMLLGALPPGVYLIEFESTPSTQVARSFYFVSDLRLLVQGLPAHQKRLVTVNATTGQPVSGANIRVTTGWGKQKKTTTVTTDSHGEYIFDYGDDYITNYFISTKDDRACPKMNPSGDFSYRSAEKVVHSSDIYTDRRIYRPGQTVHVAAIFYKTENGYISTAEASKHVRMKLRDANYQVVAEADLTTDEFGTCTHDFTLPSKGLTGQFTIIAEGESHSIKVEEYKRPTFEVEFPTVNQLYEDGDTVVVRAKARSYAGVPVQGAQVKYKVVRRQAYWWMSYSRYWGGGYIGTGSNDEEVSSGEGITDADGSFLVEMPMILPKTKYPMFYNFVVMADVTDQAGETHQGQLSLPLGNRKKAFSSTLADKVLAEDAPQVSFNLRNSAGMDIPATVRYRIDNGKWKETATNTQLSIIQSQMKSGLHTLEAVCEGDTLNQKFTLFSLNDKRPATETDDWFFISDNQFPRDGQPVTVQVGSSDKDVHIVYSIIAGNTVIESGYFDGSNELINRKLTYKEEYGNGLLLTFAWMKNGKTYKHDTTIKRPLPDMNLRLQWQTFRDRLTPGQEEEWTLTVVKPDGTPANAQLLATLYDKSLDQLAPHHWSFHPYVWLPTPSTRWNSAFWGSLTFSGTKYPNILNVDPLQLTTFDHDLYPERAYFTLYRDTRMLRRKAGAANGGAVEMLTAAVREESADDEYVLNKVAPQAADASEAEEAETENNEEVQEENVQVRENLNETAFFYPQLVTDSEGRVVIKFTLPESLTTWRFMGLAHTADMMHGMLEGETVAKKDVMIQPNMPRFLRIGDQATISARIFNTSEKAFSGTARLQLIDPETEKVVKQESQAITIAPDTTISVTFPCLPNESWNTLLIAKMSVSGNDFSDGEQHYLPILPNSERVTVTVPFTQNEPGTKEINLERLFPGGTSQPVPLSSHLTVEYTNNPAWLMIQALPTVGTPIDECAISQAASFYANSIGRFILDQNPNAKHVFQMWSREEGKETSLMSNLQKNEELKDLLLGETPWVMDANREQEQKQRLADFFDENIMNQRLTSALDQLKKLQLGDGSWSWWKGMIGSTYITIEVSEMLVRLNQMTGEQALTKDMLKNAFSFMGKEMVEMVNEMKKEEKKGYKQVFPSFKALQWLYICTIDGRQLPDKVTEANKYLINLLKKETKNQTIYEKAMSAIILKSDTYIQSLKEFTVYTEEMGRYYDTKRAGYSWRDYRIPTQVAAIEAIQRLKPNDTQTIMEMQRWLLQQKRTQAWDTPINSVDAVYAFLNGNSDKLAPQEKTILKVNDKPLDTSAATAGIGYVKTAVPVQGAKTFTAEKSSTGTSWGAVYAQFMQHTSEIDNHSSGITVKRELLTKTDGEWAVVNGPFNIGDRVKVRITIQADRNYDFIQVVDKRAACMEPVNQLSGYHWGYYCAPKDCTTNFYFDLLAKGKHVIENEYYIDRAGTYETGTCTVECAYSPEYRANAKSITINVK